LAKLFDCMAAGKSIVLTNLRETSDIIIIFNYRLVARSWNEFMRHLEKPYNFITSS